MLSQGLSFHTLHCSISQCVCDLSELFLRLWFTDVSAESGMWSYAVQSAWEVGQTHYVLDIPQHGRLLVCASQITPVALQTLFLCVCVFVLFKKNLQLPYWGCLVLPGNQSGLNQDTHKTLNPHARAHTLRWIGNNKLYCSTLHQRRGNERCLTKVQWVQAICRFLAHASSLRVSLSGSA